MLLLFSNPPHTVTKHPSGPTLPTLLEREKGTMDAPQQRKSQSGQQQQQQQQRNGRAEDDAAEEQPAGPTPPAVTITTAAAAAEEDTTPATAAAGQYDPREFQNPHPDDATTATGAAATAGRSKTAKTKGGKAAKKGGGKGDAEGEPCSNCGTLGASRKCSQCRQTQYCGEACFKVRERAHACGRAVCSVQYIQHTSPV